ncbi:hypothetical protein ED28_01280 [[Pantoea] beijingensis]|uniref:DUF1508 domain-containing protein n=1 Tax=[Pantoea] beijingensis TaxID=1324864 RepID=A0A443IHS1_9GAMM|nr:MULTISPECIES: YegP family protein [Erwiniaceae]RWR03648.1 hypothetical protein ED28_01280 [[Pantoea] beijingensis]
MSAKYEIFSGKNGQFYFRLKAGNGEVILSSEGYVSKSGCQNGIDSVKKHAANDNNYHRLEANNGAPYFTLKAANHQVIGQSEMYSSTQARDKGIESVQKNGPTATVADLTE